MDHFTKLNALDVSKKVEKKKNGNTELSYLSWCWAWSETKKAYPDATYRIKRNDQGLPFFYDELTGYMVFTEVTIEGVTHEMWLPVMDGANKAMKSKPYKYSTKYGEKTVEACSMFDINKTIMRCLTKNLAMFGLGLYIYAGEDLPDPVENPKAPENEQPKSPEKSLSEKLREKFLELIKGSPDEKMLIERFDKCQNDEERKKLGIDIKNMLKKQEK